MPAASDTATSASSGTESGLAGHADADSGRLDLDDERLLLRALAAVHLVPDLALELHLDRACLGHVDEGRVRDVLSGDRLAPLPDSLGVRDPDLEQAVVGL